MTNKTAEELSYTRFLREQAYAVVGYEMAIINFVNAANNLLEKWENLPSSIEGEITTNTRYPFQMSFDELVYEMNIWLEATISRIRYGDKVN